jgi:integrase
MATIRKRGDGYQIRVSCGYDSNGKQIIRTKSWLPERDLTEKQLQKELQKVAVLFEEQCQKGLYLDSSMKFSAFSEIWMRDYAEKQLRSTTVFSYALMLKTINQSIGHLRIDRVQPHHLMSFYNELHANGRQRHPAMTPRESFFRAFEETSLSKAEFARRASVSRATVSEIFKRERISFESASKVSDFLKKPLESVFEASEGKASLSEKTVLNYHRLISSILERAVKWQIILSNPCERVEPPKVKRKEARYLDEQQVADLLACLEKEPLEFRAMFNLFIYSGMRRGELCGLTWGDIDFSSGIIDINKSSLYLPTKNIFDDDTKNASSARSIKISSFVLDMLRAWQKEQAFASLSLGTAWKGARGTSCKVFTRWDGLPIHPDYVTKYFKDFIKRNKLPEVSVHSLRHTNASLMIASGVDIRTVSKRLGHAQTSTTTNIYAHALRTADERASDALDDILTLKRAQKNNA